MSQIIILTDKKGRRYAYRNFNYWDKQKKAPRTRREYLGRVDQDGNIIPKKVRSAVPDSASSSASIISPDSDNDRWTAMEERISRIEKQMDNVTAVVSSLAQALGSFNTQNEHIVRQFEALHSE